LRAQKSAKFDDTAVRAKAGSHSRKRILPPCAANSRSAAAEQGGKSKERPGLCAFAQKRVRRSGKAASSSLSWRLNAAICCAKPSSIAFPPAAAKQGGKSKEQAPLLLWRRAWVFSPQAKFPLLCEANIAALCGKFPFRRRGARRQKSRSAPVCAHSRTNASSHSRSEYSP